MLLDLEPEAARSSMSAMTAPSSSLWRCSLDRPEPTSVLREREADCEEERDEWGACSFVSPGPSSVWRERDDEDVEDWRRCNGGTLPLGAM